PGLPESRPGRRARGARARRARAWPTCRPWRFRDNSSVRPPAVLPRRRRRHAGACRRAIPASAVDPVRDANQELFDLSRAEVGVEPVDRRDPGPESGILLAQPAARSHRVAMSLLGESRNPSHAHQAVGFIRREHLALLATRQRALRDTKDLKKLGGAEAVARRERVERRAWQPSADAADQRLLVHIALAQSK